MREDRQKRRKEAAEKRARAKTRRRSQERGHSCPQLRARSNRRTGMSALRSDAAVGKRERREYQSEALLAAKTRRLFALLFERQAGKSTVLSEMAVREMIQNPGGSVIYASASLVLGTEIVLKAGQVVHGTHYSRRSMVERDAGILMQTIAGAKAGLASDGLLKLEIADAEKDKLIREIIKPEDYAEMFEQQRLEFRVYHDNTRYSRTRVIAPNVATARGWSGTVLLDEIAFIRDFMELWTAVEPIISTNADFRLVLATTPPQDDTHAAFELLAAPAGMKFDPNPRGNWYESEAGIPVLRADAYDTHLAGKKIFDVKTGEEITPAESFARAINKDGWRLNHGLQWLIGGTAAVNLLALTTSQERGASQLVGTSSTASQTSPSTSPQRLVRDEVELVPTMSSVTSSCSCFLIDTDADFDAATLWLARALDPSLPTGLGFDVATTTKEASNPSVLAVAQGSLKDFIVRAFIVWKTRDPEVARERLGAVLHTVRQRTGERARALAIDATNEKYFAEDLRNRLRGDVPVLLIVGSESVNKPGLEKSTNWKEYLGDQYVALIEDNRATLPPGAYVRADHRLVKKDRGRFVCEPNSEGMHGDTFDAGKLAAHALMGSSGTFAFERIELPGRMGLGRMKAGVMA